MEIYDILPNSAKTEQPDTNSVIEAPFVEGNENVVSFVKEIDNSIKIKAEAGGYKGENINDYINKYSELGIILEKDNIKLNKGLKLLAKNMLNNLWGKFGQKDNLPTTEYVNSDQWFRLLQRHKEGKITPLL
jgi:hypothetical protein